MRGFARRLFALSAAASAALLAVVLALWVRGHFRADSLYCQPRIDHALHLYRVGWWRGRLSVGAFAAESRPVARLYWESFKPAAAGAVPAGPDEVDVLGVRLLRRTENVWHPLPAGHVVSGPLFTTVREVGVSVPCWQAAVLSACLPGAWVLRRRRRMAARLRRARALCTQCGYDLRATPQRCPECGTAAIVA